MTVLKEKLYVRRKAKGEVVLDTEAPRESGWRPTQEELARALAWYFLELLDEGVVENQAELARVFGVSRARVSQVLAAAALSVTQPS